MNTIASLSCGARETRTPFRPQLLLTDWTALTTSAARGGVTGCRWYRWVVASTAVSSDGGAPAAASTYVVVDWIEERLRLRHEHWASLTQVVDQDWVQKVKDAFVSAE